MAPPNPRLADIRDRWLANALVVLDAEPGVLGVALVGSLGRGTADDWSDVDLFVIVRGDARSAISEEACRRLGDLAIRTEAPHNTRADGCSFGAVFLVDGLPLLTDWYLVPERGAAWPSDSLPVLGTDAAQVSDDGFEALNGRGPRGAAPMHSEVDESRWRISMTPIAAKKLVRGSPDANDFVGFLTRKRFEGSPAAGVDELRWLVTELSGVVDERVRDAIDDYLALAAVAVGEPR